MNNLHIKRIYESPEKADGARVLVDRVWPRGISKEKAQIVAWMKEIAPSTELRKWFDHIPERFAEFTSRYEEELSSDTVKPLIEQLESLAEKGRVTFVYSAKDEEHNQAVVLKKFLLHNSEREGNDMARKVTVNHVPLSDIAAAQRVLSQVVKQTPLQRDHYLSEKYNCNVFLKREDLQVVRSFKIRGAYNFMQSLPEEQFALGIVCASAGNHAQGVAYSCHALQIYGKIYMPNTTPRQKVGQVKMFGGGYVEIILHGDTFDDAFAAAMLDSEQSGKTFVHPFDDPRIIAGNGTIGWEIVNAMADKTDAHGNSYGLMDYMFMTVGGGGLAAGVGTYMKSVQPSVKLIGVEPEGAPSMTLAFTKKHVVGLDQIDPFVDGAAVKKVGELTFSICRRVLDDLLLVAEGKVCTAILELYNRSAIVVEPAGALSIAALDDYREEIIGKNVVCIISGSNNDIDRMQEIKERSLIYEGLKHYFIVNFPQRAGALREFLDQVLGPNDDITRFEYTKKHNKDNGPALVGIELSHKEDYEPLIERMRSKGINYTELNKNAVLFQLLI